MSHPLTQIGDKVREMTDDEYAAHQQCFAEVAEMQAELIAVQAEAAAARDSARAKLAALGLTEAEIAALVGV